MKADYYFSTQVWNEVIQCSQFLYYLCLMVHVGWKIPRSFNTKISLLFNDTIQLYHIVHLCFFLNHHAQNETVWMWSNSLFFFYWKKVMMDRVLIILSLLQVLTAITKYSKYSQSNLYKVVTLGKYQKGPFKRGYL